MLKKMGGVLVLTTFVMSGCTHGSRGDDEVRDVPRRATATTSMPLAWTRVDAEGDNSEVNQVTGTPEALTADDQSNGDHDVELTRKIRRSLTADDHLSTYAQNIKIITKNGQVVLKGPVRTATEKATVESRARQYAGAGAVASEVVVTPR